MPATMRCPYCDKAINAGAVVCRYCREDLPQLTGERIPPPLPPSGPARPGTDRSARLIEADTPRPTRSARRIGLAVGLVVVLALVAFSLSSRRASARGVALASCGGDNSSFETRRGLLTVSIVAETVYAFDQETNDYIKRKLPRTIVMVGGDTVLNELNDSRLPVASVAFRSSGDCASAKALELSYYKQNGNSYNLPLWTVALLDLSQDKPRIAPYPYGTDINNSPENVFRVVRSAPWTVVKVQNGKEAQSAPPVQYAFDEEGGVFFHEDVPKWMKELVRTMRTEVWQPSSELDMLLKKALPSDYDAAREELHRVVDASQGEERKIEWSEGRYLSMHISSHYFGNHPLPTETSGLIFDGATGSAWHLSAVWDINNSALDDSGADVFPVSGTLRGSEQLVPITVLQRAFKIDVESFPASTVGRAEGAVGVDIGAFVSEVGLNLPWRCEASRALDSSPIRFTACTPSKAESQPR